MSSYADTAWGYDLDSIGYEPGTTIRFVPDSKELKLFKEEKSNMYKGTWMICLVYGLSALTLLGVVFLTEWGRTYVYEKFLPAVLTFVIGAIFIIVYLLFSIFALQPRKIGKGFDTSISCPDYWKLQQVDSVRQSAIIDNNVRYDAESKCSPSSVSEGPGCDLTINHNDQYHIQDRSDNSIVTSESKNLKFKCVPDQNVLGKTNEYKDMKKQLNNKDDIFFANTYVDSDHTTVAISSDLGGSGSSVAADAKNDQHKQLKNNNSFLYKDAKIRRDGRDEEGNDIKYHQYIDGIDASDKLLKYASLSGAYKSDWKRTGANTDHTPFKGSLFVDVNKTYEKKPLICNEIYPGLLDDLEEEEGEDKLKCELAKTCGISWSKLNCY